MKLVKIDSTHELEEKAAEHFLMLKQAAELAGHAVEVSEAFRTRTQQQFFWNRYQTRLKAWRTAGSIKGQEPSIAARPGKSAHELGLSVDLRVAEHPHFLAWLRANAHTYGFFETTPSENWHWTFISARLSP